jgi:hypothetical protein
MEIFKMNEKIKELAIEAKLIAPEYNGFDHTRLSISQQKFAELIVRECANHCDLLLDHKINSEWSRGTHDCSKAIKKHFGVKE